MRLSHLMRCWIISPGSAAMFVGSSKQPDRTRGCNESMVGALNGSRAVSM